MENNPSEFSKLVDRYAASQEIRKYPFWSESFARIVHMQPIGFHVIEFANMESLREGKGKVEYVSQDNKWFKQLPQSIQDAINKCDREKKCPLVFQVSKERKFCLMLSHIKEADRTTRTFRWICLVYKCQCGKTSGLTGCKNCMIAFECSDHIHSHTCGGKGDLDRLKAEFEKQCAVQEKKDAQEKLKETENLRKGTRDFVKEMMHDMGNKPAVDDSELKQQMRSVIKDLSGAKKPTRKKKQKIA